jgi:hypothetical protein
MLLQKGLPNKLLHFLNKQIRISYLDMGWYKINQPQRRGIQVSSLYAYDFMICFLGKFPNS